MTDLCRPLPPLPEEVPIRWGERPSSQPSAPVSPEGATGREEVAAQVGAGGQGPTSIVQLMSSTLTSSLPREEVRRAGGRAVDREIARDWLAYCRALLRGERPAEPDRRQLPFPDPEEVHR